MPAPRDIDEFCNKIKMIKSQKWIKTHRPGPTGIGKTLEDLLEIEENNIHAPDFADYELKAMRTKSSSMLTLFTKSPSPHGINSCLLQNYGFVPDNYNNKVLHITLNANRFTNCGNTGKSLKINCTNEKIEIIDNDNYKPAFWDNEDLRKEFSKKYIYRLAFVFADSRYRGANEEFYFHTAWELYDFSFDRMIDLLREGLILVDIRIGRYASGNVHDHGTGFRIKPQYLSSLFLKMNVLVDNKN